MCWRMNTVKNRSESCRKHPVMKSVVQICPEHISLEATKYCCTYSSRAWSGQHVSWVNGQRSWICLVDVVISGLVMGVGLVRSYLDWLWVWAGNSNTHATYDRTCIEVLVCYAAFLALHLSDDMLDEVNKTLISKLQQKNIKADAARTYVQTIGAVRSHPFPSLFCNLPSEYPCLLMCCHLVTFTILTAALQQAEGDGMYTFVMFLLGMHLWVFLQSAPVSTTCQRK